MHWKDLDNILSDQCAILPEEDVQRVSYGLYSELEESVKPLHAAKVLYILALLQLKCERPQLTKASFYIDEFSKRLQREIDETDLFDSPETSLHLLFIRKTADQQLHHLMSVADVRGHDDIFGQLAKKRTENHEHLLELHGISDAFKKKEEALISKAFQSHSIFFGLLLAFSLFFGFSAIFNLSDYALASFVYTQGPSDPSIILYYALLLVFSGSFLWAFVRYHSK